MTLSNTEHRAGKAMAQAACNRGHDSRPLYILAESGAIVLGIGQAVSDVVAAHPDLEYLKSYVDRRLLGDGYAIDGWKEL